ncbi:Tryptophan--tRNA ligase, mitochondrial, partial [Tulasnella sp. 427]
FSSTLTQSKPKPKTIFSGIQPTGVPHLGNLLGALSNWVELQNNAAPSDTVIFSTVGYHAITMPQDPKVLREDRLNALACLLAVGVDPKRSILFLQDQSKLAVSRNANSEEEVSDSLLNLGLFAYPVLQAADILLYKATHVPVGEDQQQHLELSRDIAELFNRTHKSNIFPLPQHIITPAKRILSLRDPTQKMSKSAPNPKSRILITDQFSQIQAKIRSAVTDSTPSISYDPENRPGVANLLTILASCSGTSKSVPELAQEYSSKNHAELKADVTEAVERLVGPIRENYRRIRNDEAWLREVSDDGIRRAREIAAQTMKEVKHQIGLGPL